MSAELNDLVERISYACGVATLVSASICFGLAEFPRYESLG